MKLRIAGGLAAILGLLLLAGCFTLSVYPFYLPQDVVWDPDLLGRWQSPEDSDGDTWQFLQGGDNSYRLLIHEMDSGRLDPELDGVFTAHLFRIGANTYLDLLPAEPDLVSDFYKSHIVPAHSIWLVQRQGHILTLRYFESDRMEQAIEEGVLTLDYVERDNVQVLTAGSEQLREMLSVHGEEFFGDSESLQRIQ